MYLYQKRDSLNLTLTENNPVETPDVSLVGYEDGVEILLDGTALNTVEHKELKDAAQIVAFQKNEKLYITFKGAAGVSDPEIEIDEETRGNVSIKISGDTFNLTYTDKDVTVSSSDQPQEKIVEQEQNNETDVDDPIVNVPNE